MYNYKSKKRVHAQSVPRNRVRTGSVQSLSKMLEANDLSVFDRTSCGACDVSTEVIGDAFPTDLTYEELIAAGWERVHELA